MVALPVEDIQKIIQTHFPDSNPIDIKRDIEGTSNVIFSFVIDQMKYALKIFTKQNPNFYTEVWALKKQKFLHAPAPTLYFWDNSKTIVPYRYIIQEFVSGEHLDESNEQLVVQTYKMLSNDYLEKIHQRKVEGYGPIDRYGKGTCPTWNDFLVTKYERAISKIKERHLLSPEELEYITRVYQQYIDQVDVESSQFILGDLRPKNFFIKDGRLERFIDLKAIMGGDPLWEYAVISFYVGKRIWPAYVDLNVLSLLRFHIYMINIYLNKLWYRHLNNKPIDGVRKALLKHTSFFKKRYPMVCALENYKVLRTFMKYL